MYKKAGKRFFDLLVSLVASILFAPVFVLIAIVVKLKLGSPVLFIQSRPGLHGKAFTIYKFRSMIDAQDEQGNLLPDAERLPAFGKFLRNSSLDELPELWNVFKGDMSLVGPRPLLTQYLELYTSKQARRHDVKPGITGWAQVNGRNAISWEEKFDFDIWYVDNQSLHLDIKILFLTLLKVFQQADITQEGQATVERFCGSPKTLID